MEQGVLFLLLVSVHIATSQFFEDVFRVTTPTPPRRTSNSDPALLGQIGNMFLNFDEAFSKLTAPKEDISSQAKEQLYDKTQNSRSNYFERIRENYKDLQQRVGSALGMDRDTSIFSDFLGVNVRNKEEGTSVDVSLPFLPMRLSMNTDHVKKADVESAKSPNDEVTNDKFEQVSPGIKTNLELGAMKFQVDSKFPEIPGVQVNFDQARSSRPKIVDANKVADTPKEVMKEGMKRLTLDLKESRDSEHFSARKGEDSTKASDESKNSGRILGDVLYSESTFDKIMKRVIKDSMWLLDSDLSPSKAFDRLNKFTENARGGKTNEPKSDAAGEVQTAKSQKPLHYEIQNKLDSENLPEVEFHAHDRENYLLAFTLEGVPLKLKIPAGVEDPLRFLHSTLSAANVALNVPVNSYNDMEASGKEVLQIGAGNGGMARALFVDLAEPRQLKSLLKILRKFRSKSA